MSERASRRGFFRDLAAAVGSTRDAMAPEPAPPEPGPPPAAQLSDAEIERYARQLVLPEWGAAAQLALSEANVLVVGAGALAAPVAAYLVGAGVGRLGILDPDVVELSNLHRQTLHFTPDLGVPKAQSGAAKLGFLNPEVVVEPYRAEFNAAMVDGQDLVVDCTDSFAARYAINAACCVAGVPLVEGGVVGLSGLVMAIRPGETACYRCAFPEPPPVGAVATCAQAGVLGPAAGVVGSLQALEALKLLAGLPEPLADAFLQIDLAAGDFLRVTVSRRADCPDCADA